MASIKWVLFDLGGVLLEVEQSRIFEAFARVPGCLLVPAEVEAKIRSAKLFWSGFMEREISPEELARFFNMLLKTQLSEGKVVEAVNAELGATITSTAELLPGLRKIVQVGCLSNTNSIHWEKLLSAYEFMGHFDRRFASQMLGCAKPDNTIYEKVEQMLEVDARSILFFDDRQENIDAAARLGWNARLYVGAEQLRKDLREFSLA